MTQHWSVMVCVDGEEILTIESNGLSGVENINDYDKEIRNCARHLLAFIGEPHESGHGDNQGASA